MRQRKKTYTYIKRGLDIICAGTGLLVLSPIIGATALAVRAKLGSPVIFKQDRPGLNGELFTLYKFRTMLDVDSSRGLITNEDRMTSFGQKLRSTSLDELPTLINVVKGDMSLVGPRPLMARYLESYTPEQARRHEVRPGIAGLAQVNGRNSLDWEDRFAMDVKYVDDHSFLMDTKLIIKTIAIAIRREGISSDGYAVGAPFIGRPLLSSNEREKISTTPYEDAHV